MRAIAESANMAVHAERCMAWLFLRFAATASLMTIQPASVPRASLERSLLAARWSEVDDTFNRSLAAIAQRESNPDTGRSWCAGELVPVGTHVVVPPPSDRLAQVTVVTG